MVDRKKGLIAMLITLLIYPKDNFGGAFQPEFLKPITNVTVPIGRDATFTCHVGYLGGYRVGWVKADTKAIQAIHDHVITHNPRISVSHGDHSTWSLHIKGVQMEDAGLYMCQVNTDPMKSQTGRLNIVVPPDFVPEETSGDVMVGEGGQVKLTCRARGTPAPRVIWRREDGRDIILREPTPGGIPIQKTRNMPVSQYEGEILKLSKVSRAEMGAYLCIASNGVPPTVSKRVIINVHFPPVIHVPNQLVGAPLGTDVVLECFVEASPKSINYWIKDNGAMIISSNRHDVQTVAKSAFEIRMTLTVRSFHHQDVGSYRCVAKNSLGEVESSIRLYEIPGPTRTQTASWPSGFLDEDEEAGVDVYGSDEFEKSDGKQLQPIDNTVYGQAANPTVFSTPSTSVKVAKKRPTFIVGSSSTVNRETYVLMTATLLVHVSTANFQWR
ncbi:lachesin-like [Neodiprion fabricii]|uniref:lachesin-like n=1 Tax=Neodiprion fabricii TaxID=2872261 RepID=UPI001ED8FA96|nr:lachesin-like [Neodiprion fabricii]